MTDLTSLEASETAKLELTHPVTQKKLGVFIELYGMDSEHYQKVQRKVIEKRLEKARNKDESESDDGAMLLADSTVGWEGIEVGGKAVKFSRDAAVKIYSNPKLRWVKEQVDRFIADRANFINA